MYLQYDSHTLFCPLAATLAIVPGENINDDEEDGPADSLSGSLVLFNTLNVKCFYLIWVLRDRKMLEWLEPIITSPKIGRGKVYLYLTQTEESVNFPSWMQHNIYGDRLNLYKERPNWDRVFDYVSRDLHNPHCFVCGPESMTNRIAEMCRERRWDVSVEKF